MKKKNVALLLLGVTNEHCGGAERFFADLFRIYNGSPDARHKLFLFTDKVSAEVLHKIGKLQPDVHTVILKNANHRFKKSAENINLLFNVMRYRIDIIHVTSYGRNYFDRLKFISTLPSFLRPVISVSMVDCEVPYILADESSPRHKGYALKYMPLFNAIRISGIFSWYRLFNEFAVQRKLFPAGTLLEAATSRFAETSGFSPSVQKRNEVVYAARLTEQKRPLMFIEAVKILQDKSADLIRDWHFSLYGKGPLEENVKQLITRYGLEKTISLGAVTDMKQVFAHSKCFVSTQDYENFPSLAMNEAMAAGNSIVARSVGQTALFVKDGVNGYLAKEDSAYGVAMAIKEYISNEKHHLAMQNESIRLTNEVHTPSNFIRQIDAFWEKLIS